MSTGSMGPDSNRRPESPGDIGWQWVGLALAWAIRHWLLVLILVGALIYALVPHESDNPRQGYYDTGDTVTEQECYDQGGELVDDVCYVP